MVLVNTVLVHFSSGVIDFSSCLVESCGLVGFRLFLVWCMWPLDVVIDGGMCLLIGLIVKFGHITN